MEAQYFWHLSLALTWILLASFPSMCTGINGAEIKLNRALFVAFINEDLSIDGTVHKPTNQTSEDLQCFNPSHKPIYSTKINPIAGNVPLHLELKKVNSSGLYTCRYDEAEVKWFVRVTDKGHRVPPMLDYTELILVATFTGMLLVFSVLGSVYVFRGHWKQTQSEPLDTSKNRTQSRADRKEMGKEEDSMDMSTAQSSSFYASLEPRPRSIYDVLDCSAANGDELQTKPRPSKKDLSKEAEQSVGHQDEGIFESVYENF